MPYSFAISVWVLLRPLQTVLTLKMQETSFFIDEDFSKAISLNIEILLRHFTYTFERRLNKMNEKWYVLRSNIESQTE